MSMSELHKPEWYGECAIISDKYNDYVQIKYEAVPMKQIQHTALRKKVSCYHYLIKSSDNLKPFLQLFNNRSKNSLTSRGTPLKKWS